MRIVDRPCGFGKTNHLISSFNPNEKYLVVVPYLGEVQRLIEKANVPFMEPSDAEGTKRDSLELLLAQGVNIVTTHALYKRVACLAKAGKLGGYHVIIDEVPDTCAAVIGVSPKSFKEFYLERGYATLSLDGRVLATQKWVDDCDLISDTLSTELFALANAGMLHLVDGQFFMWVLPIELLTNAKSFTVYTYMAEGSMLIPYLRKLGVPFVIDRDPEVDLAFRRKAASLIEVRDIPSLSRIELSYSKQTKHGKQYGKVVGSALKNVKQRQIEKIDGQYDMSKVMITCAKQNWYLKGKGPSDCNNPKPGPFASNSRIFKDAQWVANTTRGTNDYIECTHAMYLYDQNMNPYIKRWLGLGDDPQAQDRYALAELIQWVYRTRVRRGEKIVLYLPNKRMRDLFLGWLETGLANLPQIAA